MVVPQDQDIDKRCQPWGISKVDEMVCLPSQGQVMPVLGMKELEQLLVMVDGITWRKQEVGMELALLAAEKLLFFL